MGFILTLLIKSSDCAKKFIVGCIYIQINDTNNDTDLRINSHFESVWRVDIHD